MRAAERVKDYPQISLRLPPDVRETLEMLSRLDRVPQWRVIVAAIDCYLQERSDEHKELKTRLALSKNRR